MSPKYAIELRGNQFVELDAPSYFAAHQIALATKGPVVSVTELSPEPPPAVAALEGKRAE